MSVVLKKKGVIFYEAVSKSMKLLAVLLVIPSISLKSHWYKYVYIFYPLVEAAENVYLKLRNEVHVWKHTAESKFIEETKARKTMKAF